MLKRVFGDLLTLPENALYKTCRYYAVQAVPKSASALDADSGVRTDPEWVSAKPFSEVPRPSTLSFVRNMLPGGKYHNLSFVEMQRKMRGEFGPIIYIEGYFRRKPSVFVFEPEIIEKVFRNEGPWPVRQTIETFNHFRKNVRPDIFKDAGGLLTEHGQKWADFRTLINPLMLKPKNIQYYTPQIDEIASEFLARMRDIRDPKTLELPGNFENEANRWSLESISSVALNTRLGLLDHSKPNPRGEKLMECVKQFFQLSYDLDFLPSVWKYYETPKLKRLMRVFNDMTEICLERINEVRAKLDANPDAENHSILAQLLKQNEHAAIILAMDLMIAGIDTTSSAFISVMYSIAKHPDKQEVLRKEILKVLPNKTDPVTTETLRNLPYLRACIKEALRIACITSGTARETPADLVLAGYQVPKGTNILLASMLLANDSQYFPEAEKFVPERWLREDVHDVKACPMAKSKNPYSYLPFGFGPRMCIGKRLAEMEAETLLLKVFRNFNVEWHHGEMQYRNNLIRSPTGELKFKLIEID